MSWAPRAPAACRDPAAPERQVRPVGAPSAAGCGAGEEAPTCLPLRQPRQWIPVVLMSDSYAVSPGGP